MASTRVVLASMPYAPLFKPSIGLGLLQAGLRARGIASRCEYAGLEFAARTGVASYLRLSESFPDVVELAGEWVFREALFGPDEARDDAYLLAMATPRHAARRRGFEAAFAGSPDPFLAFTDSLRAARAAVPGFMEQLALGIVAANPRIVGFTSTFQQNVASLALARTLRERIPGVFLVMGGANVEGPMGKETLRAFPWIDAVVSGEGDHAFPELVERVFAGRGAEGIPGVFTARAVRSGLPLVAGAPVTDLDALPDPEYADYFEQLAAVAPRLDRMYQPHVPFESSRGCWWGEVSHCTFCGLNGASMRFRSKGATRALDELERLSLRHPGCPVAVVDNIIDNRYFQDFVPGLAKRDLGLSLFYEVKANLKRSQVAALHDAGIREIQPGIESLDSEVLSLMGKGVKAIANIQLLRLCAEEGVAPRWNLLWGFPGEPVAAFGRMAALAAQLTHLTPPEGGFPIRLDRFSPNYDEAAERGFARVRPAQAYGMIYPLPDASLERLAYFFDYDYAVPRDVEAESAPLAQAVEAWRGDHAGASLFTVDVEGVLLAWDLRPAATRVLHVLRGAERDVMLGACEVIPVDRLAEGDDAEARATAIDRLHGAGLMVREGGSCLALPLVLGRWAPSGVALERFMAAAEALGAAEESGVAIALGAGDATPSGDTVSPHPLRLSPGHFRRDAAGLLHVDLASLRAIEWNRLRFAFSGLPQAMPA